MEYVHQEIANASSIVQASWTKYGDKCAIVSSSSTVRLVNQRGDEIDDKVLNLLTKVSKIKFSNTSDRLAIGFSSGDIKIYQNSSIFHSKLTHTSNIVDISWSQTDEKFFTFDESGLFCIWDCNSDSLHLITQRKFEIPITNIQWLRQDKPSFIIISKFRSLYLLDSLIEEPDEILQIQVEFENVFVLHDNSLVFTTKEGEIVVFRYPYNKNKPITSKIGDGSIGLAQINDMHIALQTKGQILIYNIENETSKIIRLKSNQEQLSIAYDINNSTLISVLNDGSIFLIKSKYSGFTDSESWEQPTVFNLNLNIESIHWSSNFENAILNLQNRKPRMIQKVIFKMIPLSRYIAYEKPAGMLNYSTESFPITAGSIFSKSDSLLLVSSPDRCEIFMERSDSFASISRFTCNSFAGILGESVYTVNDKSIEVRNIQGVVKQTTSLPSKPKLFSIYGKSISVLFDDNSINTYDLSRRQPKLTFSSKFNFPDENFRICEMKTSCGGQYLSFIIDKLISGEWIRDEKLYLHITQLDRTVAVDLSGRMPESCLWDEEDQRLVCIHAIPKRDTKLRTEVIIPVFVNDEGEIFLQQSFEIGNRPILQYLSIPYIYITRPDGSPVIKKMPQFEGLDDVTDDIKKSILDFNFNLATGGIDEAFESIKGTTNPSTWRSLAQVAAQAKRTDLAALCLAKIGDPFSIYISKNKSDKEEASYLTTVALKLYSEARQYAASCNRYDLVASLERSLGDFSAAITTSTLHSRMILKRLHHEIGRFYEIVADYTKAVEHYELSQSLDFELPRLANSIGPQVVFDYVSQNPAASNRLKTWCARFFEAQKNYDYALAMFTEAKNESEYIRLLCILKKWEEASNYVNRTKKPANFCYYARMLIERLPHVEGDEAGKLKRTIIELFRNARQFGQAMKFAMEKGMIDDVIQLSLSSPRCLVIKAAEWFSALNMPKNAILMYSRAGQLAKALQLCFELKQYDALDEISDSFTPDMSPRVLVQCSHYFAESDRWSKAALCLAYAKRFDDVIELCSTHRITLSDNVINNLVDSDLQTDVLAKFASLCEQQQRHAIASKIYIKLKQYPDALKAIIKTGDTDKVLKLAKMMKKKETYIIAANYLQTLDSQPGSKVFEAVESIYQRANMLDNLLKFYNIHIESEKENSNYEICKEILEKSLEVMHTMDENNPRLMSVQRKINVIESFIIAKQLCEDPEKVPKSMSICVDMLKDPQNEECVKSDDVYVVLSKCYITKKNYKSAYKIMSDLSTNGLDLEKYFDVETLMKVFSANGKKFEPKNEENKIDDVDSVDEIDDIVDDI